MKWPAEFDFSIENGFIYNLVVSGKGPEVIYNREEGGGVFSVRYRG